ncbi:MAG TPA: hypothetical protein VFE62_11495 [Gemmataceae bacterium]|nr:hypothetical protein [Gemmataceae bacterium]
MVALADEPKRKSHLQAMVGSTQCLAVAPHNTHMLAALNIAALQIFSLAAY